MELFYHHIIMRTVPVTWLFQFIRLLHCFHIASDVFIVRRAHLRISHHQAIVFTSYGYVCLTFLRMIILYIYFIHSPRFLNPICASSQCWCVFVCFHFIEKQAQCFCSLPFFRVFGFYSSELFTFLECDPKNVYE